MPGSNYTCLYKEKNLFQTFNITHNNNENIPRPYGKKSL